MKRILVVIAVISSFFYWSSCSNDFELIADWKDIPVVYALLNVNDTAHYVRVEKAFLDPETSALQQAQIPDSIYYPNASVKLIRTSDDKEFVFTRVDGNKEGYQREEGIFADSPNWLYKFKPSGNDTLAPETEYQIVILREEDSEPITGKTTTVAEVDFTTPTNEGVAVSFYSNVDNPQPLSFTVKWKFDKDNTKIFDVNLIFHYDEMVDGQMVPKSFRAELLNNFVPPDNKVNSSFALEPEFFYSIVAANIQTQSNVRSFRFVEFEVIGGSQDFKDYLEVNQANTGLTSSQLIPNFTNLSEGYGLIGSRYRVSQEHILDLISRDSLKNGQYTRQLNFQ